MQFKQIIEEMKGVEFDLVRVESDYYFEAVILLDKLPVLTERLQKVFGGPLCPPAVKLPKDVEEVVEDFGGIRGEQALYFKKDKEYSFFAMLWPWSDEYHFTVKLGRK